MVSASWSLGLGHIPLADHLSLPPPFLLRGSSIASPCPGGQTSWVGIFWDDLGPATVHCVQLVP